MEDANYLDLLYVTLNDLYGINVRLQAKGVYEMTVGSVITVVTKTELDAVINTPDKFLALLRKKVQG